jgi:hypothetical protein
LIDGRCLIAARLVVDAQMEGHKTSG